MGDKRHLSLSDRIIIESSLKMGLNLNQIAKELGKNISTISREVFNRRILDYPTSWKGCANRANCTHKGDLCSPCNLAIDGATVSCFLCVRCHTVCPDYSDILCPSLLKAPFVCNACQSRRACRLTRRLYQAKAAHDHYLSLISESRKGFAATPEELMRLDEIITPLIKQGQSIHQICVNNADIIMFDERTIYNYIDKGLLTARNLDLPRKTRYKQRRRKPMKVDKHCHVDRCYSDFKAYIEKNPDVPIVEMDTVEGRRGGKVLLTICFRNSNFMLAFLRDSNTAHSVVQIFHDLYELLGHDVFCKLFPIILTDRGSEFTNPIAIEAAPDGEIRSRIFYCDPQRSDQKGGIEVTHELIRRILPKGTSFDYLRQEDILLMMSHINSYSRKKFGDQTSYDLFKFIYGIDILNKLGIQRIPANNINLTPQLLKR